ncbi:hypothetical protein P691DRAFT_284919 [Macrolepiota fuliginosa MF-IS2]|uniref:Tail specific protease domain-containing protein n=1 Tax=Macrolepiota fuliginosa MF-IS2 TaxID=1400762 RepID=A0A9P6C8A2_9AGAR|nr:hypothetical protein P691DRAFT_284919 [Macrolepiota fuliginosa MF-IS2]
MHRVHLSLYLLCIYLVPGYTVGVLPNGPCFKVGGEQWVLPRDARACMSAISFDKKKQENVLDVVTKTLAFHASTNYQLQAPKPYSEDVHWDLLKELEGMRSKDYPSDFDFHRDVQQSVKQVNDGHLMYANWCYDSVYVTYNPFPLVLLTNAVDDTQAVHIAPNAHEIALSLFGPEIKFWEDALGTRLQEFSGAQVMQIDGEDPFFAVNANAHNTGYFQGLSSRQNAFFSSVGRGLDGWNYVLGEFAEKVHPIVDSVRLTIKRVGSDIEETITVPYRSKFNRKEHFIDRSDYESKFCKPTSDTNGHHLYRLYSNDSQEQPGLQKADIRPTEIALPPSLQPALPQLEGSYKDTQFYLLKDKTGVLVLGSFEGYEEESIKCRLLQGLQNMHKLGVKNLIIDVTNNFGGFVCVAQFLHRLLFGETDLTYPQAGLDTALRASDIAQQVVKNLPGNDPDNQIIYNQEWYNATNYPIEDQDWFTPINVTINGRPDAFSQRFGKECEVSSAFCRGSKQKLSPDPLFKAENIVLLSNGRCGSSCAVFSVLLAKRHKVHTVVVGGKSNVPQQYCGFVGGQRNDSPYPEDIPPPLDVNAALTVTWRLAYGVDNPDEPEEWQDHTATMNFPLTINTANKPQAIWDAVYQRVFSKSSPVLQVQI